MHKPEKRRKERGSSYFTPHYNLFQNNSNLLLRKPDIYPLYDNNSKLKIPYFISFHLIVK